MKINIAISANRRFLNTTYNQIVNGFLETGINKEDIYIFNGNDHTVDNEKIEDHKNELGVNLINLNYNCFEVNTMLGILENKLDNCDYWFVCHDTCEILKGFKQKIYEYDYKDFTCVRGTTAGGGGIGAYKYSCFERAKDKIYKIKNISMKEEQRIVKNVCTMFEDEIFRDELNIRAHSDIYYGRGLYGDTKIIDNKSSLFVGRRAELFQGIDLIKYKANWDQFPNNIYAVDPKDRWIIDDLMPK